MKIALPGGVGPGLRVAALIATLAAAACSSGPSWRGGASGTKLETIGGHFLLGAEYTETQTDDGRLKNSLLRSEVGVELTGRVYDPKFLRFSLAGLFGLTYANSDFEPYPGYNVFLNFLPEHPYPITLYALSVQERGILESFGPSPVVQTLREEFGGSVGFRIPNLFGQAGFLRSYIETDGLNSDTTEERDAFSIGFRHTPSRWFRTRVHYVADWVDQERTAAEDQTFRLQTFQFQNTINTGEPRSPNSAVFLTYLNVFDRSGTAPFYTANLFEDIRWFPIKELESRTRFDFGHYRDGRETIRHSLGQSLTHYLYDTVVTTLGGAVSKERSTDGKIKQAGGTLDILYQKDIPVGALVLRYQGGLNRQENDLKSSTIQVIGEPHVLSIDTATLLDHQDVLEESVVVSNPDRTIIYDEGFDYILIPRGRLFELQRVPGGRILEGDAVIVDYDYLTAPDLTFDTKRHFLSLELNLFQTLRLYARKLSIDQDVVRGEPAKALQDTDDLVLGADLALGDFRIRGEYEDSVSTYSSFSQVWAEVAYRTEIDRRISIGASLNETRTMYPDGEDRRIETLQGILQSRIGTSLLLRFEPAYRLEKGRGPDRGEFNFRLGLDYTYGDWQFNLNARYRSIASDSRSYGDTFAVLTMVKRW